MNSFSCACSTCKLHQFLFGGPEIKELMSVFYCLILCRVHPWPSHLNADPERFSKLKLIPKASFKIWVLISLAIIWNISLHPLGASWLKGSINL